jgi:phage tail tape-measure protein
MAQLVNALFLDRLAVHRAVEALLKFGYRPDDIAVMTPEPRLSRSEEAGVEVDHADKTAQGAALGGAIGAVIAGSAAAGLFFIASPWAALVAGIGVGGLGGSLCGALVGSLLKESPESHDAPEGDKGGTIVALEVDDTQSRAVRRLLEAAGGKFVQSS